MAFDLQTEVARIYEINEKWWRDIRTNEPIARDDGELFMLMASELAEAMEGERRNLDDDKLPQFKMAGVEMCDFAIRVIDYAPRRSLDLQDLYDEGAELLPWAITTPASNRAGLIWGMNRRLVQAFGYPDLPKAGALSRLIADARHYCRVFGYPFEEMYEAKVQFNITRADHQHESRMKADGKKF
jgi:hypothetical protein